MEERPMLSRVAESLYWMSRYLERAEHTARILEVNLFGRLDQQLGGKDPRWARVLRGLSVPGAGGRRAGRLGGGPAPDVRWERPAFDRQQHRCRAAERA